MSQKEYRADWVLAAGLCLLPTLCLSSQFVIESILGRSLATDSTRPIRLIAAMAGGLGLILICVAAVLNLRREKWLRRLGHSMLVTTLGYLVAGLLGEALCRIMLRGDAGGQTGSTQARAYGWGLGSNAKIKERDPRTGKSFTFRTNSRGWKDVEHEIRKPKGVYRILLLGDSCVYGGCVRLEDTLGRQLETEMRRRGVPPGRQVEVISIGVPGWSTDQEYIALQEEGLRYEPDLVLLWFSLNDVPGNLYAYEVGPGLFKPVFRLDDSGALVRREIPNRSRPAPGARLGRLRIVQFVRRLSYSRLTPVAPEDQSLPPTLAETLDLEPAVLTRQNPSSADRDAMIAMSFGEPVARIPPTVVRSLLTDQSAFCLGLEPQSPRVAYAFKLTGALLAEMKHTAESKGAIFLIFTHADRRTMEATPTRIDVGGKRISLDPSLGIQRLRRMLSGCGVGVEFVWLNSKEETFYPADLHPTPTGIRRISEQLVEILSSKPRTQPPHEP